MTYMNQKLIFEIIKSFSFFRFLDESPRWLIAKKRFAEATAIIHKMAAINVTQVPENMFFSGENEKEKQEIKEKTIVCTMYYGHFHLLCVLMKDLFC